MRSIFAIYKPKGPSSHQVLAPIKRKFPGERVGHAGTLDPLASGVLVVGVGRQATRLLHTEKFDEKEYLVTIELGAYSTTDDVEGKRMMTSDVVRPTKINVATVLKSLTGEIQQAPPQFSAVKVAGTPAYKTARAGKHQMLAPRTVQIKTIELLDYHWPKLKLRVVTGPGVYIRSLARDIGAALQVGGFVAALERTRVGEFGLGDTLGIDEIPVD